MDPNSPMDEKLKSYSARRRDEAQGAFELHPADRKMLQHEVARTFPAQTGKNAKPASWFGLFGPRLVFASGIFATLLVVCVILFREPSTQHLAQMSPADAGTSRGQKALADEDTKADSKDFSDADKRVERAIAPSMSGVTKEVELSQVTPRSEPALKLEAEKGAFSPAVPAPKQESSLSKSVKEVRIARADDETLDRKSGKNLQPAPEALGGAATRFYKAGNALAPGEKALESYAYSEAKPGVDLSGNVDALFQNEKRKDLFNSVNAPAPSLSIQPESGAAGNKVALRDGQSGYLDGEARLALGLNESTKIPTSDTVLNPQPGEIMKRYGLDNADAVSVKAKVEAQRLALARTLPAPTNTTTGAMARQSLYFSQDKAQAESQTERLRAVAGATTPNGVLSSFQVQIAGNQLTVVDYDGSTYMGTMTPEALEESPGRDARFLVREQEAKKTLEADRAKQSDSAKLSAARFDFIVSGTNKTLNQPVRFKGSLAPAAVPAATAPAIATAAPRRTESSERERAETRGLNAQESARRSKAPGNDRQSNANAASIPGKNRIEGKAEVGAKVIEVKASETAPR